MSKRWFMVPAGLALLAIALVALPGNGREQQAPDWQVRVLERSQSEFDKAQQKVEAAMCRLQDLLEEKLARVAEQRAAWLDGRAAQLEAERARKVVQVEAAIAELQDRHADALAHAQELAEQAVNDDVVLSGDGETGWLGVGIAEVTSEKAKELKLPAERGALVTGVEADSPAAKAGLKANDVITEFNGQRVEGAVQLRRLVRETPPGRSAQLTIWREGGAQTVSVQLGNRSEQIGGRVRVFGPRDFNFDLHMPEIFGSQGPRLGISADDLSGQLGAYFGVPEGEGVLVREVTPGSPAEKAGIKAGDVITKVDGQRVKTTSGLRAKLREKREQKSVSVSIIRKGAEMSLSVEIEQPRPVERRRIASHQTLL